MQALTIGEVARRVGVRQSAIRYYESEGLLPETPRRGGRRLFDGSAVARLQVIRAARELGFSLDDIRRLLHTFPSSTPPPERWRALAAAKLPEIDDALRRLGALRRLLVAGMACRCVSIDECFLEDCSSSTPMPLPLAPSSPQSAARAGARSGDRPARSARDTSAALLPEHGA